MTLWYRVFGGGDGEPPPATLLEHLNTLSPVAGQFGGDGRGWFRAALTVAGSVTLELERFHTDEDGTRSELNGWAAHLEAGGEDAERTRLMERVIQTRQLFTLGRPAGPDDPPVVDDVCVALCRCLAEATEGVYQIDGRGFFAADGSLLVRDE